MKDPCAYYGLKREPFDKEIKTSELIDTLALRECTARLEFMKQRGGIMLLTGDPGVGKTVALRCFTDKLNENIFRPLYTHLATLNRLDILRHINNRLGLPTRGAKSAIYTQIQTEVLESKEQRGRTVILVIDEAQLLQVGPLQELRLMTNFKMDSCDPFILILAGQSELKRVMDYAIMEPMAQRLKMRYHMPPLSPEETGTYVEQHLKRAGATEPIFSADALGAMHDLTFGIPRRIGAMASQAMLYAMFDNKRTVDADMVLRVKTGG